MAFPDKCNFLSYKYCHRRKYCWIKKKKILSAFLNSQMYYRLTIVYLDSLVCPKFPETNDVSYASRDKNAIFMMSGKKIDIRFFENGAPKNKTWPNAECSPSICGVSRSSHLAADLPRRQCWACNPLRCTFSPPPSFFFFFDTARIAASDSVPLLRRHKAETFVGC